METIMGRLTANAKVNTVKGERRVVNFSVAINDRYKTRGGDQKETTRYFQCAYWSGVGIAPFLTKGLLVELAGRIDLNVWNNPEGKPRGSLTMHVSNLKMHGKSNADKTTIEKQKSPHYPAASAATDDLPF